MSGKFVETVTRSGKTGALLCIRIQPRSSRLGPLGRYGSEDRTGVKGCELKWGVNSPPVEGAANEELIIGLARFLGVPKSSIGFVSGEKSRSKTLFIVGVDGAELERKLLGC